VRGGEAGALQGGHRLPAGPRHAVHHPEAHPEEGAARDDLPARALANLPQGKVQGPALL